MTAVEPFRPDPVAPERLSMSFIRAAEGCLRRAHMERQVQTSTEDALIGRVFHEAAAAVGFACVMRGQARPSPVEAVGIAKRIMARPEEIQPLPKAAWDEVIRLVSRWAERATFRPDETFEIGSRQQLAGRTLSARIDREAVDGTTVYVKDYKTGWGDPADALSLQGEVYSWHEFERHPDAVLVVYEEDHVRMGLTSGPHEITRDDVYGEGGTVEFLQATVSRIDDAYRRGELPPNPGAACSAYGRRCPVASTCPVPEWAKPATVANTREEAVAAFKALLVGEAARGEQVDVIRGWLEHAGERALQHNGEEIGRAAQPGSSLDKKRLQADLAEKGAGINLGAYTKPTNPTFGRRKAKT
jgi:PD-(D/E)XK nuclease superfamily